MNYHIGKKIFQYFFLSIFLVLPFSSQAQVSPYGNRNVTDAADALSGKVGAYSPPAVYATKTILNPIDASGTISGTFTILNNSNETVGDIKYRVELLEALPEAKENEFIEDNGRLYDSALSPALFALLRGEEKVVPFTYTPPAVPAGDYRLVVQLTTSQGRDLGWDTAKISLGGNSNSFVDLIPGNIILPEFPDQDIASTSGPNVSPNTSFSLEALATNTSETAVTVTPTLTVYNISTSKGALQTFPQTSITIQPKQELEFTVPVTASTTPGAYYGTLAMMRSKGEGVISPIAEYRWVVRGSSGSILSARIDKLFTKANEKVSVALDFAGPADAETVIKGTLAIEVLDTNGVAGAFTNTEILELNDGITSGIAQVPLTRDLIGTPGLRITLKAEDGTILDTYEVKIPLSEEQIKALTQNTESTKTISESGKNKYIPLYVLAASLLIGLLALVLHMHKKKHSSTIPLGLFFVLSTLLTVTHGVLAQGNGIEVTIPATFTERGGAMAILGNKPAMEIFINKPIHNASIGTYNKSAVPFEYRIEYGVCKNRPADHRVLARFDKNGGAHSNLTGISSSSWQPLLNASITYTNCKGARYCLATRSGTATLNISSVSTTAPNTTLQIGSFWRPNVDGVPDITFADFNTESYYLKDKRAHIINLWLNFFEPPTVTTTPTSSPTTPTPFPPTPVPPTPISGAPVAIAKMSIDGGKTYNSAVTVTQGVRVPVLISAGEKGTPGSYDPDGWDTVSKGVSKGGKIEWNNNLWLGEAKFETTFTNPATPSSADMNLGDKIFTLTPGTYTYSLLKITDAGGLVSNIGAVTLTVITNPDPFANKAPYAVAKMSINGGAYSSNVTVTQGERVDVRISAGEKGGPGSYDPDGWDTVAKGVSKGGKIEWNSDLNLGVPTYETTKTNPATPSSADMNLGDKIFTLTPGTYTYSLLKITDAGGLVSNGDSTTAVGTVKITVKQGKATTSPSPSPSTPPAQFNPGGFKEVP